MSNKLIELGIVGVGKIVRDQHLPSIAKNSRFNLAATASPYTGVEGVPAFKDIDTMLDAVELDAVALCMPPQYRRSAAKRALERGKHVLLEKPPGATVLEVEQLATFANTRGLTMYASWHSRHAAAIETAKSLLAKRRLISASMTWKEDVRKWHPGQEWIWQAGGLGVFDPGINGLSILTDCLTTPLHVCKAKLMFPENKAAPIAAEINMVTEQGITVTSQIDWRVDGAEAWTIDFETDQGSIQIDHGGAALAENGQSLKLPEHSVHVEYESIYRRFAQLIMSGESEVDLRPFKLVADAFLLGEYQRVKAFLSE